MRNRSLPCVLCIALLVCVLTGCDAHFAAGQWVQLSVRERQSLRAVSGATITVADRDVHRYPGDTIDTVLDRIAAAHANTGKTDEGGQAAVLVNTSFVKSGLYGALCDPREALEDRVSGRPFVVRVSRERSMGTASRVVQSEVVPVTMKEGVVSAGEGFVVTLLSIGPPIELKDGGQATSGEQPRDQRPSR